MAARKEPTRKMTHVMAIALSKQLEDVCKKHMGFAVYAEGWDDDRVAKTMTENTGDQYSERAVYGLRKSLYGDIAKKAKPDTVQELQARIELLEKHVARLTSWAVARPVQGFKADPQPWSPVE